MNDSVWTVYVHINKINKKRYVGITSQKPEYRWNRGKGYKNNSYFVSAIKKYGWDGFEHVILRTGLTKDQAIRYEKTLIEMWKTKDRMFGYNLTDGGEGTVGYVPPKELREKWSKIRTGTKRSSDTKKKMSDAHKRMSDEKRLEKNRKISESKYKPVLMYSTDGVFIKRFRSAKEAINELGLSGNHITDVCNGRRNVCGGYVWKYA